MILFHEGILLPALIERAGTPTLLRFAEFFAAQLSNRNTRGPMPAPCVCFSIDAWKRAAQSEIASMAVIVDVEEEQARRYYDKYGSISFPEN